MLSIQTIWQDIYQMWEKAYNGISYLYEAVTTEYIILGQELSILDVVFGTSLTVIIGAVIIKFIANFVD